MAQKWCLLTDTHTGATTGLTPSPNNPIQEALLSRYYEKVEWFLKTHGEPDVVLHLADAMDGTDRKSGDIDDPKMTNQAEGAAELIAMLQPKSEVILLRGTKYHTAVEIQEFEEHIDKCLRLIMYEDHDRKISVSIRSKLKTTINDWFMLEARHFIGSSIIPHGRATTPLREQMWNVMNAALEAHEKDKPVKWPDLMCFGHRHYYLYAENAWGAVMCVPGWQALGNKFGEEICSGHIGLGLVGLTIGDTKEEGWSFAKNLSLAGVIPRTESR